MNQAVTEIITAGDRFQLLLRKRREGRAQAITSTAKRIEQHLGAWRAQLRDQLHEQLRSWNQTGIPPDFIKVAGQSHLEKPLNKLLAWWSDPDAEHGLGIEFVKRLAMHVRYHGMAEDLERGEKPEINAERALVGDESGRMPDLLIRTSSSALLLENKRNAPESGNQYGPYLTVLQNWAGYRKERSALLCAPELRDVPQGWDGILQHAELGQILDELSNLEAAPIWGRIAACLCARSFYEADEAPKIREARELLALEPTSWNMRDQISRLRALLPLPKPPSPWEIGHNG